jgi:iron-sulfur cluster assembly protein
MAETLALPIQFTEGALNEVRRLMAQPDFAPGTQLRVGVKGGGCSGLSYVLGFDHATDQDETYDFDGVPVILNRSHEMYLLGMAIDYQDGLGNRGFSFTNPNASSSCGCGSSFAV